MERTRSAFSQGPAWAWRPPAFATALLLACWLAWAPSAGAAVNTAPPASPVKLVFIHHSTGEAWLADVHGGLGRALRDNDYFVSDTNYGWGPGSIGSDTDIGHWWSWFRAPATSPAAMAALYAESDKNCSYSRLATDPGGPNEIVMFKSCFPNSQLSGPSSPIPAIGDNPLKGQSCGGGDFTVANAKGIYLDLLAYFGAHPEKLFVAVVAPPVTSPDTPGGRALANWLVDDWLQDSGYTAGNVVVFDYYDVLSSKAGGGTSDVGLTTGNHHRVWNNAIQHRTSGANRLAYPSAGGDSHPNAAGDRKATAEFLPLLNAAYNAWKGVPGGDSVRPRTSAPRAASVRRGRVATLYYRVDDQSRLATVVIRIKTRSGSLKKTLVLGMRGTGTLRKATFRCTLKRGTYRFWVDARNYSGNPARTPLGTNRLWVR